MEKELDPITNSRGSSASNADDPVETGTETKKGIFVRLGPESKQILEKAAENRTYAEVIEKLLEFYGMQEDGLQQGILSGKIINPSKDFEDLLALTQTAQHAFENKRFYYAAKTYQAIAKNLDQAAYSSNDLREVCNYRSAHCWIRISYDLRSEALKKGQVRSYTIATNALETALKYLRGLRDGEDPLADLIKHYNMACCYSLQAQYEVESKLGTDAKNFRALREAEGKPSEQTADIWEGIGETWRNNSDKADEEIVNGYAIRGQKELDMIYQFASSSKSTSVSSLINERMWIVEAAKKDSDLIFMRADRDVWSPKFDDWVDKAPGSDAPLADAIADLLRTVPI